MRASPPSAPWSPAPPGPFAVPPTEEDAERDGDDDILIFTWLDAETAPPGEGELAACVVVGDIIPGEGAAVGCEDALWTTGVGNPFELGVAGDGYVDMSMLAELDGVAGAAVAVPEVAGTDGLALSGAAVGAETVADADSADALGEKTDVDVGV